jgi:glycosyltransferase involved in cell wall biosynthesis
MWDTMLNPLKTTNKSGSANLNDHGVLPGQAGVSYRSEGGTRSHARHEAKRNGGMFVTIITVNFNGGPSLDRCIRSVLCQTYENIEYLVIDGGSTDESLAIIARYEDRIDYWLSEPDGGIYEAMNKGLALARGDIIAFLNSDDYYYPFAVRHSVNNLEDSGAAISAANADIVDEEGNFVQLYHLNEFDETAFLGGIPANHQTIFARRDCYEKVGSFDTSFRIAADTDWLLKAIDYKLRVSVLPESIVAFAVGGASGDIASMWNENARVLQKRLPSLTIDEIDNLSKFAYGYVGSYDAEKVKEIFRKNIFTDKQRVFLERRMLELDPALWRYMWRDPSVEGSSPSPVRSRRPNSDDHPLVSVITVVLNCREYLERCILSVLNQSYANIEYIVIDGGSTDGSLDIIRKYAESIDSWTSGPDRGVYDAMNKGLALAHGEYIALLNADDMFYPDAAETSIEVIRKSGADYSIGGCSYIDEQEKYLWTRHPIEPDTLGLFNFSIASHQTYFVHKACYEKVGEYDTEYRIAADYKFRNLLIQNGFKPVVVPGVIVYSSVGGLSMNGSGRDACLSEVVAIARSHAPILDGADLLAFLLLVSEYEFKVGFEKKLPRIMNELGLSKDARGKAISIMAQARTRNIVAAMSSGFFVRLRWLIKHLLKSLSCSQENKGFV